MQFLHWRSRFVYRLFFGVAALGNFSCLTKTEVAVITSKSNLFENYYAFVEVIGLLTISKLIVYSLS